MENREVLWKRKRFTSVLRRHVKLGVLNGKTFEMNVNETQSENGTFVNTGGRISR